MSLLLSLGNPYESATPIAFGDGLNAIRYDISDVTLPRVDQQPIYGAIVTHTTEAPVPQGLYAVRDTSFYWQSPDSGHVTWVCIGTPPEPPVSIPEPGSKSFCILAVLLLAVVLVIRGLRKGSNCGWAK
jgi:hypothetical protein